MRLARFIHLLDLHGADLTRWPPAEAEAARALLPASAEARARLRQVEVLEAALRDSRALPDAAALARMRAHVAGQVARLPLPAPAPAWAGPLAWLRGAAPIGGGALAVLLACGLWLAYAAPFSDISGFNAPRQIATIESFE